MAAQAAGANARALNEPFHAIPVSRLIGSVEKLNERI